MSWRGAPLRRPTRRQAAATPASLGVALLLGTAQDVAAAAPPTGGDHPPGELLAAAALGRAVRKAAARGDVPLPRGAAQHLCKSCGLPLQAGAQKEGGAEVAPLSSSRARRERRAAAAAKGAQQPPRRANKYTLQRRCALCGHVNHLYFFTEEAAYKVLGRPEPERAAPGCPSDGAPGKGAAAAPTVEEMAAVEEVAAGVGGASMPEAGALTAPPLGAAAAATGASRAEAAHAAVEPPMGAAEPAVPPDADEPPVVAAAVAWESSAGRAELTVRAAGVEEAPMVVEGQVAEPSAHVPAAGTAKDAEEEAATTLSSPGDGGGAEEPASADSQEGQSSGREPEGGGQEAGGAAHGGGVAGRSAVGAGPDAEASPSVTPPCDDVAPPGPIGAAPPPEYSRRTVVTLKEELRARGLPVSGRKSELVARLEAADSGSVPCGDDVGDAAVGGAVEAAGGAPSLGAAPLEEEHADPGPLYAATPADAAAAEAGGGEGQDTVADGGAVAAEGEGPGVGSPAGASSPPDARPSPTDGLPGPPREGPLAKVGGTGSRERVGPAPHAAPVVVPRRASPDSVEGGEAEAAAEDAAALGARGGGDYAHAAVAAEEGAEAAVEAPAAVGPSEEAAMPQPEEAATDEFVGAEVAGIETGAAGTVECMVEGEASMPGVSVASPEESELSNTPPVTAAFKFSFALAETPATPAEEAVGRAEEGEVRRLKRRRISWGDMVLSPGAALEHVREIPNTTDEQEEEGGDGVGARPEYRPPAPRVEWLTMGGSWVKVGRGWHRHRLRLPWPSQRRKRRSVASLAAADVSAEERHQGEVVGPSEMSTWMDGVGMEVTRGRGRARSDQGLGPMEVDLHQEGDGQDGDDDEKPNEETPVEEDEEEEEEEEEEDPPEALVDAGVVEQLAEEDVGEAVMDMPGEAKEPVAEATEVVDLASQLQSQSEAETASEAVPPGVVAPSRHARARAEARARRHRAALAWRYRGAVIRCITHNARKRLMLSQLLPPH
eukprot:jgi/Tetstr1/448776/TSEL_036010.t1